MAKQQEKKKNPKSNKSNKQIDFIFRILFLVCARHGMELVVLWGFRMREHMMQWVP